MADSEKLADLSARLRSLANGDENTQETSKSLLLEAAAVLGQSHSLENSYVLVLIDAHSHPFINEIFNKSSNQNYPVLDRDQPYNIRNRLYDAIRKQLIEISSAASLRTSRLVVRVYANSAKLENELLCPLQQFTIQFSSMDPYFDFIGVRDEAIVEAKVADTFQTARHDPNCKHVFFAAWMRPVYLAMLQTPSQNVTLVHGKAMGAGAKSLRLSCKSISIPEVFSEPEGKDPFSSLTSHSIGKQLVEKLISNKVFVEHHVATSCDDNVESTASNDTTDAHRQPGGLLQLRNAIPGHVPVNANGQRLDYYMQQPSVSEKQAYLENYDTTALPPCKWFHLVNICHYQDACVFDHSEISTQVRKVIEYSVRRKPCKMGSECRRIDCIYGHVCQDTRCITDGLETCGMRRFHGMDKDFARWVKGKHAPEFPTGVTKEAPAEDGGNATLESSWF